MSSPGLPLGNSAIMKSSLWLETGFLQIVNEETHGSDAKCICQPDCRKVEVSIIVQAIGGGAMIADCERDPP
jgi:hypothetical protein